MTSSSRLYPSVSLLVLATLAGCVGQAGLASGQRPAASALRFQVRFGPGSARRRSTGGCSLMLSTDAERGAALPDHRRR